MMILGAENTIIRCLLTNGFLSHRMMVNMIKSTRWFAYFYFYGLRDSAAVGGA